MCSQKLGRGNSGERAREKERERGGGLVSSLRERGGAGGEVLEHSEEGEGVEGGGGLGREEGGGGEGQVRARHTRSFLSTLCALPFY